MTNPTFWNQFFVWPILNLLLFFYAFFESIRIPGAFGFAIIAMTIAIRLILYPFTHTQMKSARKMAKLKPHLDELSQKYKNDKQALQKAQLALYKEHGVNPAAGCLPLLLQMPVLFALYNVFYRFFNAQDLAPILAEMNKVIYHPAIAVSNINFDFFGLNLVTKPSEWQTKGIWLLAIPILTALLQWYQTKLMMNAQPQNKPHALAMTPPNKDKDLEKKQKPADDAMEIQKQMAIISPIMFGIIAFQFPIGLALYWNVFGVFGIIQQYIINKRHG